MKWMRPCADQTCRNTPWVLFKHLLRAECLGEVTFTCHLSLRPAGVAWPPQAGCERFRESVQGCGSGSLACHGEIVALPNLHLLANSVFVGSWFCFFSVIILFHLLMKNITFGNWLMLKHILLHSNNILCLPEFTASYFAVHCRIKTHSVW